MEEVLFKERPAL